MWRDPAPDPDPVVTPRPGLVPLAVPLSCISAGAFSEAPFAPFALSLSGVVCPGGLDCCATVGARKYCHSADNCQISDHRDFLLLPAGDNAPGEPRFPAYRGFPAFNAIRDVCHVTIHSDDRGLCPNRNDGRDLHAPYVRDRGHGHRAPGRYRRLFAQRQGPSASPRPGAWALSSVRREPRQRSTEIDSFDIPHLGRDRAAQGNVADPRKFHPT